MPAGSFNKNKTECVRGHAYTVENTLVTTCSRGNPRRNCRACAKESQMRCKHGIDNAEYNALYELQNGQCAICKLHASPGQHGHHKLQIDHCHATGKIRGLLCINCNTGIGKLMDGALFDAAIRYLGGKA